MSHEEIWKPVNNFEGLYEVSTFGRVRSIARSTTRGGIRKISLCRGYEFVRLCKNGIHYNAKVHRMVAEAFLPKREVANEINHIDGNKRNNHVSNLEWCTPKENMQHSKQLGLNKALQENNLLTSHPVIMFSPKENRIKTFPSISEAMRSTGVDRASVQRCCVGKQKTAGGYKWMYHTTD